MSRVYCCFSEFIIFSSKVLKNTKVPYYWKTQNPPFEIYEDIKQISSGSTKHSNFGWYLQA